MTKSEAAKVAKMISKAKGLTDGQLEIMAEVDESEAIRDAIRAAVVRDVMIEMMECLKNGEDLGDAIMTIAENF